MHATGRAITAMAGLLALAATPAFAQGPQVGAAAPAFTSTDTHGQARALADFRGRWVVLEWWNKDCPYVRKHYGGGNMQALQRTYTAKGVVWITINSSAPGKQGHVTAEEANLVMTEQHASPTYVLLDPDGRIGHLYDARNTPQMFVIDPDGVLRYDGAIDDRPTARPADLEGAHNYLAAALDEAMAGRPVTMPRTQPYGCTVKY